MTEQERIAAFIAERGITKIAEGEAALSHMTARDWHKAARDTITIQAILQEYHTAQQKESV